MHNDKTKYRIFCTDNSSVTDTDSTLRYAVVQHQVSLR